MRPALSILCITGVFLLVACHQARSVRSPAIAAHFRALPRFDTLRFEISDGSGSQLPGDTIPNPLFFSTVPAAMLLEIDYLADSAQALVLGRQHFSWNDSLDAYWVDLRQHWFQHQSLLLYHRQQQTFMARVTVAEWYGGDGGQVLTGIWLLDYDGDGNKDLIRREIEHSLVPDGENMRDIFHESALLLRWQGGRFVEWPLNDSALIAKRFPLRTPW